MQRLMYWLSAWVKTQTDTTTTATLVAYPIMQDLALRAILILLPLVILAETLTWLFWNWLSLTHNGWHEWRKANQVGQAHLPRWVLSRLQPTKTNAGQKQKICCVGKKRRSSQNCALWRSQNVHQKRPTRSTQIFSRSSFLRCGRKEKGRFCRQLLVM